MGGRKRTPLERARNKKRDRRRVGCAPRENARTAVSDKNMFEECAFVATITNSAIKENEDPKAKT
jgi:hypothetical protein